MRQMLDVGSAHFIVGFFSPLLLESKGEEISKADHDADHDKQKVYLQKVYLKENP
jgi:hypothetical protein